MPNQPFFTRDGARLVPNTPARGPWTAGSLHGRVIIGLLGAEIERLHGDPAYMPARLTVDMYKAPDMSPLEIVTRVLRDGHRIKVIDAELISNGQSAGRASCQFLRRTANPPGRVWTTPDWDVPRPGDIPDPGPIPGTMHGLWTLRPVEGQIGVYGQRRTWMKEVRELVGGEALTPFGRVAVGCDYASPLANAGDDGLGYINSDVTLYLHRTPATEWVGFESIHHAATDGVAIGGCYLYDEQGRIGSATVCALAQTKPPQPRR
ncbi:acyl-CoA thioesterase domain-containing protein [Phenylobacterium sp.]|jgi:hypothetical protein|uniref:acyl-CoA thioesterase domain-containing protein n=1 Tax=Phenylobacterium sp. TaxID=1871053 RepID=UPI002F418D1D